MKKKNLITLAGIALVVALIATGIFYGLFVSELSSNQPAGTTLVVAATALEAGRELSPEDLTTIQWPAPEVPPGGFERVDQLAGQTLFDPVESAEPIMAARLVSPDGSGRGEGVPEGMRAVSIHVTDSTGIMERLRGGYRVDAQVVSQRGEDAATSRLITALENLQVLSVQLEEEQSAQGLTRPVVTLLATPQEADILAVSDAAAQIRLTLRNPLDERTRRRTPISLTSVMRATGEDSAPE